MSSSFDELKEARAKLKLLFCPHDGEEAQFELASSVAMPFKIACKVCFCCTPNCRTAEVARVIWNRRIQRKPPFRVTSSKPSIRNDGGQRFKK